MSQVASKLLTALTGASLLLGGCTSRERRPVTAAGPQKPAQTGTQTGTGTGVSPDGLTPNQQDGQVITAPDNTGTQSQTQTTPATSTATGASTGGAGQQTQTAANTATQTATNTGAVPAGKVKLNDLVVGAPSGWTIAQQGSADGIVFVAFGSGDKQVTIYSKQGSGVTLQQIFTGQATQGEASKKIGNIDWKVIGTSKSVQGVPHAGTYNVCGFLMERGGFTYWGYARGASQEAALADVTAVLETAQ